VRKRRSPSIVHTARRRACRSAADQMNIPQLEITHQNAEIEITSQRARIEISSQRPRFRLQRNLPRMHVDRRLPKMHVDRSQAAMMLNKGPVLMTSRQQHLMAHQQVLENIASMSSDGTAMLHIENKGNTIAELAGQAMNSSMGDLNISALPQADINWESGYIDINWTPGEMQMDWDVSSHVDIRVEPHYVEIRMVKHSSVNIRVHYKHESRKAGGKIIDEYL
jgi:hypothetical protein